MPTPSNPLKAVRGTRDLLPPDTALWNRVESIARSVFSRYGFGEIRTPIFEDTSLFARGVGEETDIVSKEMYTWLDGDRFNEKRLIDEWVKANQSDNPAYVQAGRVNIQGYPSIQAKLKEMGIQIVQRGIEVAPNILRNQVELVSFRPGVSADAIDRLMKARDLAKSDTESQVQHGAVGLRIVIPIDGELGASIDTKDVIVERLAGRFFDFSQNLTLRPENTAGVVRAYIEHNLGDTGQLQKLFYIGPQFRRERPQRGRYRQFCQIGAEVLGPVTSGSESPLRDAEVLEMLATLLDELGIKGWRLELNSVGSAEDRKRYLTILRDALAPIQHQLCPDNQRRAETNPLRVLDSKDPNDQALIDTLPRIADFLDDSSRAHFDAVLSALAACSVPYVINPRLVRGLDYYTRTTFEFTVPSSGDPASGLGTQNALLGGGRYDGLSEMLGGPRAPGIGFAIGEDRLILTLQAQAGAPGGVPGERSLLAGVARLDSETWETKLDAYIAPLGPERNAAALALAREMRRAGLSVEVGDGTFRLKKSFEAADRAARHIVILGEDEARSGILTVKTFASGEQTKIAQADLAQALRT
jgi:histidyl-tRNA synthetase